MVVTDTPVRLSRNRNYNILWSSLLFSELGTEITFVAFPLLILALGGSAWQMGLVAAAVAAAHMAANVPAGVVADRWDRKRVMVLCQAVRVVGLASIGVALLVDAYSFPHVLVVAVVEGALSSVFEPAEHATLAQVVPESQLGDAVARNTARPFIATLLGPALAGFLFAWHRTIPFLADALMLAFSLVALLFLRLPARTPVPAEERTSVAGDLVEGVKWLLGHRVIRTTMAWMVLANTAFGALVIVVIASSGEEQVGAGQIGLTMACIGAGGLLGAVLAGQLHSLLPPSVIIIGFTWIAALMTAVMSLVPAGLPMGLLLAGAALFAPVANTVVMTYQLMVTPDEMRGRLSGLAGLCAGGAAVLGPLVGGLVMGAGQHTAVLLCAAGLAVTALGTTLSPVLRSFPRLVAIDDPEE
ncbi:MFS transporter [Umezawaea sp. NPDC059074]|uniref:MFS transporter n=1 Tax=Umezawaea sp. NPDC059074 TaxID=3346716 RepID=UPI00369AF248